jgi:hypothetical protein
VTHGAAGRELAADRIEALTEQLQLLTGTTARQPLELDSGRASCDQVATVAFAGERDQPVLGGGADPAAWRADRAAERLRVARVGEQRQIGESVADLASLLQPE